MRPGLCVKRRAIALLRDALDDPGTAASLLLVSIALGTLLIAMIEPRLAVQPWPRALGCRATIAGPAVAWLAFCP
jgi:hypothetical protein